MASLTHLVYPETIGNMCIAARGGRRQARTTACAHCTHVGWFYVEWFVNGLPVPPQSTKPAFMMTLADGPCRRSRFSSEEKESDAFHVHVWIVHHVLKAVYSLPIGPVGNRSPWLASNSQSYYLHWNTNGFAEKYDQRNCWCFTGKY